MRLLVAATLVAGLTSTTAFAADVVTEEPPAPVAEAAPVFTWTGGYVGIQGGYLWTEGDLFDAELFQAFGNSFDGGILGGYVGYNWQVGGSFVLGAEADINAVWNDETFLFDNGSSLEIGNDYLASVRLRAGYAINRTLLFATGGVAFTDITADVIDEFGFKVGEASENFTGWTVGAGVEQAFTDNLIGRLEYRFYDFDTDSLGVVDDIGTENHTVTLGLAYKW